MPIQLAGGRSLHRADRGLAALYATVHGLFHGQRKAGKWLELFEHGLIFVSRERLRVVRYDPTTVIQDLIDHRRNGVTTRPGISAYEQARLNARVADIDIVCGRAESVSGRVVGVGDGVVRLICAGWLPQNDCSMGTVPLV
ncbi:hypothetical protein [Nocardia sp. NPDC046763]|uniref:hypothetical protein n=1 Tax=Nocardia sp. NPDC046763 TaxID=3155256 RepID=UPI0033C05865